MSGKIERHMFRGVLMTASEIASRYALSKPTVMRRIKAGLSDDQIVAQAHTLPRGLAPQKPSERQCTVPEARYRLIRATRCRDKLEAAYQEVLRARDPQPVVMALRRRMDKADQSVSYWREMLRMAERKKSSLHEGSETVSPRGPRNNPFKPEPLVEVDYEQIEQRVMASLDAKFQLLADALGVTLDKAKGENK